MSEFDVKFANFERAMNKHNNFGLKGSDISEQYGRYAVGLQYDERKANNKRLGKEYAKAIAEERKAAKMAQEYRAMKDKRWQRLGEHMGEKSGVLEANRRAEEIIKQNAIHAEKQVMYDKLFKKPKLPKISGKALTAVGLLAVAGLVIKHIVDNKKDNNTNNTDLNNSVATLPLNDTTKTAAAVADTTKTSVADTTGVLAAAVADTTKTSVAEEVSEVVDEAKTVNEPETPEGAKTNEKQQTDSNLNLKLDDGGIYTVVKGDSFWKIAKRHLKDKFKNNPDAFEKLTETKRNVLIQLECERIMKLNGYWYDENHYMTNPMLIPNARLKIYSDLEVEA